MNSNQELLKTRTICILGADRVGKSTLLFTLEQLKEFTSKEYKGGIECKVKKYAVPQSTVELISIPDSAVDQKFILIDKSDILLMMYDMTDKDTLFHLEKYYKKIQDKGQLKPMIFVGTKSDKPDQEVSESDFKAFKSSKLLNLQGTPVEHIRISSMKDTGLDRLEEIWKKMIEDLNKKRVKGSTALHPSGQKPETSKGGCC